MGVCFFFCTLLLYPIKTQEGNGMWWQKIPISSIRVVVHWVDHRKVEFVQDHWYFIKMADWTALVKGFFYANRKDVLDFSIMRNRAIHIS